MKSAIDQAVAEASWAFVKEIAVLSDEPYIREAVMKMVVREMTWALLEEFGDQHALADHLDTMADLVRSHREEETENEGS